MSGKEKPGSGRINGYWKTADPAKSLGPTSADVVNGFSPAGHEARGIGNSCSTPLRTMLNAIGSPGPCLSNSAKKTLKRGYRNGVNGDNHVAANRQSSQPRSGRHNPGKSGWTIGQDPGYVDAR